MRDDPAQMTAMITITLGGIITIIIITARTAITITTMSVIKCIATVYGVA